MDDGAADSLSGGGGQHWFLAVTGGDNPDLVLDLEAGERLTEL